jgi:ribonuclease J
METKIIIHRGFNQIGGNIVEISTDSTKILIDLGKNLPIGDNEVFDSFNNKNAVENITLNTDAIFYSHYHSDHIGLFAHVPAGIDQYTGETAKKIMLAKHLRLAFIKDRKEITDIEISAIEHMRTYLPAQKVLVGDISVTPYSVSHSAYDAYMFLIETINTKILYTGDFRGHGYLSKNFINNSKKLFLNRKSIDYLITEGTMVSRRNQKTISEYELRQQALEIMRRHKYVYVASSSSDMERIASFYSANRACGGKPFITDRYQKEILNIFTASAGKHSRFFKFKKVFETAPHSINSKLASWMKKCGFTMLVRPTENFKKLIDEVESIIKDDKAESSGSVLIFSMWEEYINPESIHKNSRYLEFVQSFDKVILLHTGGHASAGFLADFCNAVNPAKGIIPIHSEHSEGFGDLPIQNELKKRIITNTEKLRGTG